MSKIQSIGGQTLVGGLNRVFHCNHYNAHLQMSILMTQGLHDAERLLVEAVAPLIQTLKDAGYTQAQLIHEFSFCGFGKLRQETARQWVTPHSHYGESIYAYGKAHKTCFFNAGFIEGISGKYTTETHCQSIGDDADRFETQADTAANTSNYLLHDFPLNLRIPERFELDVGQAFETRVDETGIVNTVKKLPLYGDIGPRGTGLVDAFGVVLTNHFADYYNRVSYETYFTMKKTGIPIEEVCEMFIQSGHICAFNTFGGIIKSPEWHAAIEPMCDSIEDWIHGIIAVINALGWGTYRVEKIVPEKELVVRIYNSYEGVGYRRIYPKSEEKALSFLAMGAVLGLAHLFWKIDIRTKPELTHEFYIEQFNHQDNSFQVEQTHAIAAGDDYDRIVVSRD